MKFLINCFSSSTRNIFNEYNFLISMQASGNKTLCEGFKILGLVIILFFNSCVSEISEEIPFEENIIVFGSISNFDKEVEILIHKSTLLTVNKALDFDSDYDFTNDDEIGDNAKVPKNSLNELSEPVENAKISLFQEKNGTKTLVTNNFEEDEGRYTSKDKIQGEVGTTYWIEINLTDGTKLYSKKEKMKEIVSIENGTFVEGLQYKIDFKDPTNDRNLYLIESEYRFRKGLARKATAVSNDVLFDGNPNASLKIDSHVERLSHYEPGKTLDNLTIILSNINFSTYQFMLNRQKQSEENENNQSEDGEEQNAGNPDQLFAAPSVSLYGNMQNATTGRRAIGNFSVLSSSKLIITE